MNKSRMNVCGSALRAVACAGLLAGTPALAEEPLGQILWTRNAGDEFSVATFTYVPPGTPKELVKNGVLRVDPKSYFLDQEGELLQTAGKVPEDLPRATLHFLHPMLDFTGKRILFTSGDSWGPDSVPEGERPNASPSGSVEGGGLAIHQGLPDNPMSDPEADDAIMDGFPVVDPYGKYLYFGRFFYQDIEDGPGWYIMRRPFEDGTPADVDFLRDEEGKAVRGYQPTLSATGQYLFFVRPDPKNVGSDIGYLPLMPLGLQGIAVHGEGPFRIPNRGADPTASAADGRDVDAIETWSLYSRMGGKGRVSHPTVSPDLGWIAYASDRDGDWDLYLSRLEYRDDGAVEGVEEVPVFPDAFRHPADPSLPGDRADDMWPSFSGDGRFLAYMSDRADDSQTSARGEGTRVWVVGLEATGGPNYHRAIDHQLNERDSMWPYWDQDEDPPHVRITLHPEGGGDPMVLELIDEDPDASTRSDVVSMALEMRDYHPQVPPPGQPARSGLEPLRIGREGGEEHARLEYPTGKGKGNSLRLLLSGKDERLGLHRSPRAMKVPSGVPGKPGTEDFTHRILTDEGFDGLYMFENVRLKVGVLARDNRWKRVQVPRDLEAVLYPDGEVPPPPVEVTHLLPHDPRGLDPFRPEAPYMRQIPRGENMDRHYPGISWWVEEMPAELGERVVVDRISNENAPYVIFRSPNYPRDRYPDAPRLYLRVVVRDLLSNVTDVRIPIHVRPKDFAVDTLQIEQRRGGLR